MRYVLLGGWLSFSVLGISPVFAHGGASFEEDSCVRYAVSSRIHFNAYQPDVDPKGHYCDDIPTAGSTIVVVDLVDQALREIPAALEISALLGREVGPALMRVPPKIYPNGVMESAVDFPDNGRYLATVKIDSDVKEEVQFMIRVGDPGFDFGGLARNVVVGLLLIWIGRRLYRRWWSGDSNQAAA